MTRPLLPLLTIAACVVGGGSTRAQQVLEIDYAAGRTVIDDEWRAILWQSAIDHGRGILYVRDSEEPEGVMAFSLETGEWLRTIRASTGGGPQELPQGITGLSVALDGRLYVAGMVRVIEFGLGGEHLSSWTPNAPPRTGPVCDLAGQPAVPTVHGVVRRGEDGADRRIGSNAAAFGHDPEEWEVDESLRDEILRLLLSAKMGCTEDAAFVATEYDDKTDSIAIYYANSNREGRLPIPADLAREQRHTVGPLVATDGRGNVVLMAAATVRILNEEGGFRTMGVVVNPWTGCHATIRNPEPNMFAQSFRGIYRDSAVVALRYHEEGRENGRKVFTYHQYANKVTLYPLRRVDGDPCPGMLPSVR